jgi:GNAT superfamily N-acetyltransferase
VATFVIVGTSAKEVVVRRATAADLVATQRAYHLADGLEPDGGTLPLHHHELEHGELLVAELGGAVVGFVGAIVRGGDVFVADLFVDPAAQSGGVGRALLGELFGRHRDAPRYTASSADPRAHHLYASFGMVPRFEIDYLERAAPHPVTAPPGWRVAPIGVAVAVELDARWSGRRRPADHTYWQSLGGTPVVIERDGTVVGVAYTRVATPPAIGPLVVGSTTDAARATVAVLAHATAQGGDRWRAYLPRPHPAHPILLDAGFVVVDTDRFMASHDGLIDPTTTIGTPDAL